MYLVKVGFLLASFLLLGGCETLPSGPPYWFQGTGVRKYQPEGRGYTPQADPNEKRRRTH